MNATAPVTPLDSLPSPSQSYSDRHPDDQRLRRRGFRIVSRPRKGEAVWSRDGVDYLLHDALKEIGRTEGEAR